MLQNTGKGTGFTFTRIPDTIPLMLQLEVLFTGASQVFNISKGNTLHPLWKHFRRALFVLPAPSPPSGRSSLCFPYVGAEVGCLELGGFGFLGAVLLSREDVLPQRAPETLVHRHDVALSGKHELIPRFVHWILFIKQLKERWDRQSLEVCHVLHLLTRSWKQVLTL